MNDATSRELAAWIIEAGLTGADEPDLLRRFCERAVAGGIPIVRAIERAFAGSDTSKIESQHCAPDPGQPLRSLIHRLGVHGASELGMRVREDNHGTRRSIGFPAFGHIEQGFQTARRSDQISDGWHGRIRRRSAQSVLVG